MKNKYLKLTVNWFILLTMPIWATLAAPLAAIWIIVLVFFEIGLRKLSHDSKEIFLKGNRWVWDDL